MRLALVLALAAPAVGTRLSDFASSSAATRGLVAGLTVLVNRLGGKSVPAAARVRQFSSLGSTDVLEGLRRDFVEQEYLWSGNITAELYDDNCIFTDPTLSFAGLSTFESNLVNLDPWIQRFVPEGKRSVELESIELVDGDRVIEASWRMIGDLQLPWRPRLDLKGKTRYTLGGEGGRISSYDESWAISPSAALSQLLVPRFSESLASDEALQPLPPGPATATTPPSYITLTDAPPVVILPGFGNDEVDYIAPLGQPESAGLVNALRTRGVDSVYVVPIKRWSWLNVLRGLADISYWRGDAQPDCPAYAWYLRRVQESVEAAVAARCNAGAVDARALLVCHSAGGWLVKALWAEKAWCAEHIRGVITLGTPHLPPPAGVFDPTRGIQRALNNAQKFRKPEGVFVLSVASDRVVGKKDDEADPIADFAFRSYEIVGGDGAVEGDGVVPLASMHFEDADMELTLKCFHSINEPGTQRPTDDWYGSERVVDSWLCVVADLLQAQNGKRSPPSGLTSFTLKLS